MFLFVIFCAWTGAFAKSKDPVDRSYHVSAVPIVNGAQGLQYYATGNPALFYSNVPAAVYIPGQVGVLNLPHGVQHTTPPSVIPSEPIPSYSPTYSAPRPAYTPYGQQEASSSFSIEQSVDLTDSTTKPSIAPSYGPPKSLDVVYRRPHTHHRTYYRQKVPFTIRGSRPPGSRPLMYTHVHKGHLHTHYLPSPPSPMYQKPPKPTYLPPPTTTVPPTTETPSKLYNYHAHPPSSQNSLVRFPDSGGLTQAVIGQPGIISNYDTNLPVKIPSPKPNQLEVKEILKNADLTFVDVLENRPTTTASPLPQQYVYSQPSPSAISIPHRQQFQYKPAGDVYSQVYTKNTIQGEYPDYSESDGGQQQYRPYSELYDQRFQVPQAFHSNHLDQEQGTADTVRIPVAVYQGVVPSMFPHPVKRSDEGPRFTKPADFSPSKTSSDWIPVTGKMSNPESLRNLNTYGDDFFAGLSPNQQREQQDYSNRKADHQTQQSQHRFGQPTADTAVTQAPQALRLSSGDTIYGRMQGSFVQPTSESTTQGPIAMRLSSGDTIYGRTQGSFVQPTSESTTQGPLAMRLSSGDTVYGRMPNSFPQPTSEPTQAPTALRLSSGDTVYGRIQNSSPARTKERQKVGDIISGRIPGDHNPFGSMGGDRDRRGGVVSVGPSAGGKFGDSSNLVVSSVIKFSR